MKKFLKGLAAICLSAAACFAFSACGSKNAATPQPPEQSDSYAIVTKLDLNINFDGDTVTAKVKNTFTLFPATVKVYVYLYYSESYTTEYSEMKEVAIGYIEDLDQGEALTASYDTKGRGGYFLARMRYKIDSRGWEERCNDVYERDYTAVILERIEDDGSLPVFKDIEPAVPYITSKNGYNGFESLFGKALFSIALQEELITGQLDFENGALKDFTDTIEKEFYGFIPVGEDTFTSLSNYILYSVYKKNDEYILNKDIKIYAPTLGFADPSEKELITGFGFWNVDFELFFNNIENSDISGKLGLQFGKCEKQFETAKDKFINIYVGENCIGTCYYENKTAEDLTCAFFYNLFVDGLRKI